MRNITRYKQFTAEDQARARRLLHDNPEMTRTALAQRFGVSVGGLDWFLKKKFPKVKP